MQMDALLISEDQRGCWHLARHLEQLGCNCWFASTTEEVRSLLGQRPFRFVLSTRPVTEPGPLMQMLRAPDRFVFYSFLVENSYLWFQAVPEILHGPRVSALRPSEFMRILDDLIARWSLEKTPGDAGQRPLPSTAGQETKARESTRLCSCSQSSAGTSREASGSP